MKTRNQARRCAALLLAVSLLLSLAACGGNGTEAATMHLMRTEGEVGVLDDAGRNVTPRDNLGLYNGYGVDTRPASYAWINLDDVKLTKLDQDSEIAIRKDGKHLEIEVLSGSLFFNVKKPLEDDETLNIRTSTMAIGVRGTCGWVEDNGGLSRVYLLEGKVECSAGEQTVQVNAWEMAELTADGELVVKPFTTESVANFVRPKIENREELSAATDGTGSEPATDSQFRSREYYVDGIELSSEIKELLLHILNAARTQNWNEAKTLAHTTIELENIAGEHAAWRDFDDGYIIRSRGFYSEFDGYRVYVGSIIQDGYFDESTGAGASDEVVMVQIRPESGQGCYIYCDYGYHGRMAEQ